MSVSPIQRISAILILIAVIIWFFNTKLIHTLPESSLVLSGESVILSGDVESDGLFMQRVLQMKEPDRIRHGETFQYSFEEGLILKEGFPGNDTLTLRVSHLERAWEEVLASNVQIIAPPQKKGDYFQAFFKLPGGQIIRLKEE